MRLDHLLSMEKRSQKRFRIQGQDYGEVLKRCLILKALEARDGGDTIFCVCKGLQGGEEEPDSGGKPPG